MYLSFLREIKKLTLRATGMFPLNLRLNSKLLNAVRDLNDCTLQLVLLQATLGVKR